MNTEDNQTRGAIFLAVIISLSIAIGGVFGWPVGVGVFGLTLFLLFCVAA